MVSPEAKEVLSASFPPDYLVKKNAFRKAWSVQNRIKDFQLLIISADTLIYTKDGQIFGKPENRKEAVSYLQLLSNTVHYVATGVAMFYRQKEKKEWIVFTEITTITFHRLDPKKILDYVDRYQPFDKAGAYGIQELPDGFVKERLGSLDNVIGLPTEKITHEISLMMLNMKQC